MPSSLSRSSFRPRIGSMRFSLAPVDTLAHLATATPKPAAPPLRQGFLDDSLQGILASDVLREAQLGDRRREWVSHRLRHANSPCTTPSTSSPRRSARKPWRPLAAPSSSTRSPGTPSTLTSATIPTPRATQSAPALAFWDASRRFSASSRSTGMRRAVQRSEPALASTSPSGRSASARRALTTGDARRSSSPPSRSSSLSCGSSLRPCRRG